MNAALPFKLAVWFVIVAVANGLAREKLLLPWLGSVGALVVSGLALTAIIFLVAYFAVPTWAPLPTAHYVIIGVVWLALTLAFEFGFGLAVQHQPLSELLRAYTFQGGNLWPLVLAATLASPWLAARLRGH